MNVLADVNALTEKYAHAGHLPLTRSALLSAGSCNVVQYHYKYPPELGGSVVAGVVGAISPLLCTCYPTQPNAATENCAHAGHLPLTRSALLGAGSCNVVQHRYEDPPELGGLALLGAIAAAMIVSHRLLTRKRENRMKQQNQGSRRRLEGPLVAVRLHIIHDSILGVVWAPPVALSGGRGRRRSFLSVLKRALTQKEKNGIGHSDLNLNHKPKFPSANRYSF